MPSTLGIVVSSITPRASGAFFWIRVMTMSPDSTPAITYLVCKNRCATLWHKRPRKTPTFRPVM
jgi:hypothetical protein